MEPLAHSASYCKTEQPYAAHIEGAWNQCAVFLNDIKPFIDTALNERFASRLLQTVEKHDLGKLDEKNQSALHDEAWRGRLPIPHQNGGARYFQTIKEDFFASALVYGHHMPGLPNLNSELVSDTPFCYTPDAASQDKRSLQEHTDKHLAEYLKRHTEAIGQSLQGGAPVCHAQEGLSTPTTLEERFLLSCLVDADWKDTGGKTAAKSRTRWKERLTQLDEYVGQLGQKAAADERTGRRNELRRCFYNTCRHETEPAASIQNCEATVGSGKTTAILSYLLRCAAEKQLRHLFVILPYTSILQQVEKVLKEAVVLPDENADQIVSVIHHRAEYASREFRELASLWEAPIILTTAVQFFESMASNLPARLRKLHQLPGSAIFLDEFHAAVPAECLPVAWQWLTELSEQWGCSVALSSGTMIRFWENSGFKKVYTGGKPEVYPLKRPRDFLPAELQTKLIANDKTRVRLRISPEEFKQCRFTKLSQLLDFVLSRKGPRIIMMDTREAAARTAYELRRRGEKVFHLSNAFAPQDSSELLKRVTAELEIAKNDSAKADWTLVCTIFAGMGLDLSFCSGFCRAFSCAAFLQLAGRVSRNSEFPDAGLWAFTLDDAEVPENKLLTDSKQIWIEMIQDGLDNKPLADCDPSELATYAFREEWKRKYGASKKQAGLLSAERSYQFADIAKRFKLITDEPEVLAITDAAIIERLRNGEKCSGPELQRGSVSIYEKLLKALDLEQVPGYSALYYLPPEKYDPELLGCFKTLMER